MNKERTISGIKVVVSGETYDEYKGTLQEQLEEKDKEIERLNNIIKEAREYIEGNYSNPDGEIWHKDIEKILNILNKEG